MLKRRVLEACVLSLTLVTSAAHAEPRDPVAAQALFDDARKLMLTGQYAEACPKLAESQRLDPGIGTAFNLADCDEKIGLIASAWALFLEVASQARASGEAEREAAAKGRAAKLEPKLPRLRIRVGADNRPPGLEITRDGIAVGPAQWGSVVPVDPGRHEIVAKAPGRQTFTRSVTAEQGVVLDFELPPLAPGADAAPAAAAATPVAAAGAPAPEPSEKRTSSGPSPLVYVLGGVGIVGVGVGTTFSFMAMADNDDSKTHCNPSDPNKCSAEGVEQRNSAIKKGNVATVGFVVGGASLAGALVLWLVGGSSGDSSKAGVTAGGNVGANGGELHLSGRFW